MSSKNTLFFIFLLISLLSVYGKHENGHNLFNLKPSKLFVFGDSYADTGNIRKSMANSWKLPYGITFPGKPAGRFSDGRVLTDYLARFIGVKSPIPYRWRKYAVNRMKYGMNFAYGGTGVFNTFVAEPNMTTQIDLLQQMINQKVYTSYDLQSSAALVSLAGNDYSTYLARNGSAQGFEGFITQVVNQLAENIKQINRMGVKKLVITSLQPIGCLPETTYDSSFRQCNSTQNQLVNFHNLLLQQALANFRNQTKDSTFLVLDLYSAFTTVLGSSKFMNPLKPCCYGISKEYSCGSLNEKGQKMYTMCPNPQNSFFWDTVHPTQAGWRSIYLSLQPSLRQLFN
ncbi:GDSL esterase/lipase At5g03610-like [Euphorbia lathyris]|uniref:GDSL esterase/lipase At5g03610-like n=1 Tax=Euphorbia lathyris TaxID=212925 RepID=UPI0033134203